MHGDEPMMMFNHKRRKSGGSHWVAQVVLICGIAIAMVAAAAPRSGGEADHDAQVLAAAGDGDLPALTEALKDGGSPNASYDQGYTALMCAAASGRRDIVKALLDRGASINAKSNQGLSALSAAVARDHKVVAEQLLRAGADPDAHLAGHHSALDVASDNDDAEMLALLKPARH
jgi:ankyrin repeat protein